jgi:hypothetical protein
MDEQISIQYSNWEPVKKALEHLSQCPDATESSTNEIQFLECLTGLCAAVIGLEKNISSQLQI